jgi:hypothetical protein
LRCSPAFSDSIRRERETNPGRMGGIYSFARSDTVTSTSFVLYDDGPRVQVCHVADELSKGMRIRRKQSWFQDYEKGGLPMTRCREEVPKAGTEPRTNP